MAFRGGHVRGGILGRTSATAMAPAPAAAPAFAAARHSGDTRRLSRLLLNWMCGRREQEARHLCALTGGKPPREAARFSTRASGQRQGRWSGPQEPTRAPGCDIIREKPWISVAPRHCREPQTYVTPRSEPLPTGSGRWLCSPAHQVSSSPLPGLLTYLLMLGEYSDE